MIKAQQSFHVMTKPAGARCNLSCAYCYYLEKSALFDESATFRMSDEVLECYVRDYIAAQPGKVVSFAWQGGEPTLMGLDFFRRAVELQKRYAAGKQIENAFQTNGTRLTDEWCAFFREHSFLLGVSIDGPRALHNAYRKDRNGKGTFDKVLRGIKLLRKHEVEFNTLTCVHRKNQDAPVEVYQFLKSLGSTFLQFIPVVERVPNAASRALGCALQAPGAGPADLTTWSVRRDGFGRFLCGVFDRWVKRDVGRIFVQQFDCAFGQWLGLKSTMCSHSEVCAANIAMEHDGSLFMCDHYVYRSHRLGRIGELPLAEQLNKPQFRAFREAKQNQLSKQCQACPYRFACGGDCPKHRFIAGDEGDYPVSYLCPSYQRFYKHIDQPMRTMARLYRAGRSPASIMARSRVGV